MVEFEDFGCEEHRISRLDLSNELRLPMVFIRDSTDFAKEDLAIFPPINHENLFKSPSESSSSSTLSDSYSSSSSSLSPSDSDEQFQFDMKPRSQPSEAIAKSSQWKSILEIDIVQGWWKLLLARVLSKFHNLVTCFSRNSLSSFWSTLRSFYSVIVILVWWWKRNRTRRRKGELAAHLRDTIKEKDERIALLLHQISQMNELLVKITLSK